MGISIGINNVEEPNLRLSHRGRLWFAQSVFGYPNEDAFERDRRGDGLGHGFFEIEGSSWLTNLHEYNRETIESDIPISGDVPRHYFIGSKDGSCQMLCRELLVEPFPGQSVGEVVREVEERERLEYQENLRQIPRRDRMPQRRQLKHRSDGVWILRSEKLFTSVVRLHPNARLSFAGHAVYGCRDTGGATKIGSGHVEMPHKCQLNHRARS